MNTMKKRILSSVLAVAMAASMAVPAFAEGEDTTEANTTKIEGTYKDVEIAVVVPPTAEAQINPYGLDIEFVKDTEGTTVSGQQIVTMPAAIINKSSMNLGVSATVTGALKEGSDMKLAATTTKVSGDAAPLTTKTAFVYFQMKVADGLAEANVTADKVAEEDLGKAAAAWNDAYNADSDIVVGTKAASKENIVTLKAATGDDKDEVADGGIAMFRLSGDCVVAPKTAWAETDGFNVNVAFTFMPVVSEASGD